MKNKLTTLYSYSNREDATDAILVLKEHGIDYVIDDSAPSLDPFFAYTTPAYSIHLKVADTDVEKALEAITSTLPANASEETREMTTESLMEKFSNEELKDVIYKKDEWDAIDIELAERILHKRGIAITREEKERMWQMRLEETRKPQKGSLGWIALGFAVALMGGLIGIAIGASYFFIRKPDMLGQKHYIYDGNTRALGLIMMLTGIIVIILSVMLYFDYWLLPMSL